MTRIVNYYPLLRKRFSQRNTFCRVSKEQMNKKKDKVNEILCSGIRSCSWHCTNKHKKIYVKVNNFLGEQKNINANLKHTLQLLYYCVFFIMQIIFMERIESYFIIKYYLVLTRFFLNIPWPIYVHIENVGCIRFRLILHIQTYPHHYVN